MWCPDANCVDVYIRLKHFQRSPECKSGSTSVCLHSKALRSRLVPRVLYFNCSSLSTLRLCNQAEIGDQTNQTLSFQSRNGRNAFGPSCSILVGERTPPNASTTAFLGVKSNRPPILQTASCVKLCSRCWRGSGEASPGRCRQDVHSLR